FPAPVDHLSFNENGGVIAASQVRSLNCCKKICQGACKVAGPHVPGPETWMHIAHWIGHGVLRNEAEDLGQRLRSSWQWLGKSLSHDSRHVAPGWLRAHVPKIGNCLINDPMRRFCYREPVGRVERLFGGNFDVRAHSFHGGILSNAVRRRTGSPASKATAPALLRPCRPQCRRKAESTGIVLRCREACTV